MSYRSARAVIIVVVLVAGLAPAVHAQPSQPLPSIESMPVRMGPLGLAPSIALTDVGVDDNVFNSATDPQSDFTATVVPRLVARLRLRRLLFSYTSNSDLVYFHEFASERSANSSTDLRLDADLGRLQPYVSATWLATKQRLNGEIDIRAPRTQHNLAAGTRLSLASRTAVVLNVRRSETDFKDDYTFRGIELSQTLNTVVDTADAGLHLTLTPLTTFALTGGVQRDRFPHAPERDSESFRILSAVQFDPTSLLRGGISLGYRRFEPDSPELPDYSGLIVQSNLSYTLLGRTRFDVDLLRDVQYSYLEVEPYYLAQSGRLTVTHLLVGVVDVQGIAGRQTFGYRAAGSDGESRRDRLNLYGAGVGFHLGERTRLSFNWEQSRRDSAIDAYHYDKRRIFAAITYGT